MLPRRIQRTHWTNWQQSIQPESVPNRPESCCFLSEWSNKKQSYTKLSYCEQTQHNTTHNTWVHMSHVSKRLQTATMAVAGRETSESHLLDSYDYSLRKRIEQCSVPVKNASKMIRWSDASALTHCLLPSQIHGQHTSLEWSGPGWRF